MQTTCGGADAFGKAHGRLWVTQFLSPQIWTPRRYQPIFRSWRNTLLQRINPSLMLHSQIVTYLHPSW